MIKLIMKDISNIELKIKYLSIFMKVKSFQYLFFVLVSLWADFFI